MGKLIPENLVEENVNTQNMSAKFSHSQMFIILTAVCNTRHHRDGRERLYQGVCPCEATV